MAYGADILAEAQELYFAGTSAARIAGELKRRHPESCKRLVEKTVLAWISTPNGEGRTWVDLKAMASAKAESKRVDQTADRMGQLHEILDDAIEIMRDRLDKAKDYKPENPEYIVQVLLQCLSKREATLKAPAGAITNDEQMRVFFEVLQSDAELGPVFERRRAALLAAYREKLKN